MTCRRCGQPILPTPYGWGHLINPGRYAHYATPDLRPAAEGVPPARRRTEEPEWVRRAREGRLVAKEMGR